ncbi:hypothetical protein RJ641_023081 [Dillenia turbinata]|uniref:Uncharacterized protein n=1 Tax=Dillenia turbinata TaxID=194707 RepID=A0AAN8UDK2_9MAGN
MEQVSMSSGQRKKEEPEFNLREWAPKAKVISRENTNSRRHSASYIGSFREDARSSFRSNFTISSTASSPGYTLRDEVIDPTTYSFTTALKALQARSGYSWECLSPDGFALNSKWNEAEKYICNPLSGEFPLECLSAKTLSGRSFVNLQGRITMSAPLVYSFHSRPIQTKPLTKPPENGNPHPIQEKKVEGMTRDVGTQSTPPEQGSSSPSPALTPPIKERSLTRCILEEGDDSPTFYPTLKFDDKVEVKETGEREDKEEEQEEDDVEESEEREKAKQMCMCSRQGGCMSWKSLWMRRRRKEKHKPRKHNIFLQKLHGC